jgi:hypothetical protein
MLPVLSVVLVLSVAVLIISAVHARAPALTKKAILFVAGWLALTTIAGASGVLSNWEARPPRMMILIGASIITFTFATRGEAFRKLLQATPSHWIVGLMTVRIPIELGLWALHREGHVPQHFTFEGRNFDMLAGLTAPFVAYALARGWLSRRGLLIWNVVSLGLLTNIVGMAITTLPGPLQLSWPGPVPTIVATWPFVWLPSFLVPVALFGHILVFRQLAMKSAPAEGIITIARTGS